MDRYVAIYHFFLGLILPRLTLTGHDWGCAAVWTFAAHYPEHCIAAAGLCVPYGSLELGLEELLDTIDRNIYPEDQYPYGQWSYQVFYESNFEQASAFFDADIPAFLRGFRPKRNPESVDKLAPTCTTVQDGGWMGGAEKPDPKFKHIPLEMTVYESEESYQELVAAMEKTSFWPADAWYMNHARNRAYTLEKRKNDGNLELPVLFVSYNVLPSKPTGSRTDGPFSTRSTPQTTPYARLSKTRR